MAFAPWSAWLAMVLSLGASGCEHRDEPAARGGQTGQAPKRSQPSAQAVAPGPCSAGPGTPRDEASAPLFVPEAAGYCIDPNGDTRSYGDAARAEIEEACTQVLAGECEAYRAHGLGRLVTLRYVDGLGTPGAVTVLLARFEAAEGAFGFFTRRVIGDGDPARARVTPLDAGAAAALDGEMAYVVRGEYLAQLSYANEAEAPAQRLTSAARVLPPLARALGARLPGQPVPPPAVARLPLEERLPLGVTYAVRDALGIDGLGPGAVGFYARGEQRYRIVSLRRRDEAAAGDVIATLRKVERATKIKDLGSPAVAFETTGGDGASRVEWVVMQAGAAVLGVGDEELVLGAGAGAGAGAGEGSPVAGPSRAAEERRKLSRTEKVRLLRRLVAPSPGSR